MSFGHFWFGDQAGRPTRPTGWNSPALDTRILPAVLGAILQRYELSGGVELKDVEGEVQLGEVATLTPKKWRLVYWTQGCNVGKLVTK